MLRLGRDDVARPAPGANPAPPPPREPREPREPRADVLVADEQADTEPLRAYRSALEALRAGRHSVALDGFRAFLLAHPRHDYADNAQYWIGECYYDLRDYPAAGRAFRAVIERYPRGNKVPDAMLKLGFALIQVGDSRAAQSVLESLTRAFPKHPAARLAAARLAQPFAQATTVGRPDGVAQNAVANGLAPGGAR